MLFLAFVSEVFHRKIGTFKVPIFLYGDQGKSAGWKSADPRTLLAKDQLTSQKGGTFTIKTELFIAKVPTFREAKLVLG